MVLKNMLTVFLNPVWVSNNTILDVALSLYVCSNEAIFYHTPVEKKCLLFFFKLVIKGGIN